MHLFRCRINFKTIYCFILCPIIGSRNDNVRVFLIHIALKCMQMGINTGFVLLFSIFMNIYSHISKYFSLLNFFSSSWEINRPRNQTVSKMKFLDSVTFTLLVNKEPYSSMALLFPGCHSYEKNSKSSSCNAWLQIP